MILEEQIRDTISENECRRPSLSRLFEGLITSPARLVDNACDHLGGSSIVSVGLCKRYSRPSERNRVRVRVRVRKAF